MTSQSLPDAGARGGAARRRSAVKRALDRTLEAVLFALLSAMTLAVLWQVVSRVVLRDPSSVTEELARFLMMWVGLLGATYAMGQGLHPSVDFVQRALGRRLGRNGVLAALPRLLVAIFALAVLVIGGAQLVRLGFVLEQTSAALRWPLGWVYAVLPISGVLLLLYGWCTAPDGDR